MSMTDPISDLLTRIRNGQIAKHQAVSVPLSRMKVEIVKILKDEGYLLGFEVQEAEPQGSILVELKNTVEGTPCITGLERVSKPGRRVYCGKHEIPNVLNGLGITIVSTSRGVMTGSACRRLGVGGEILCNIW